MACCRKRLLGEAARETMQPFEGGEEEKAESSVRMRFVGVREEDLEAIFMLFVVALWPFAANW